MRAALACVLILSSACHSPKETNPPSPTSTTAEEAPVTQKGPKISFDISTPQNDYKASFAPSGGVASPEIKLGLVMQNEGAGAWVCEPASITIEVTAERSKRSEKRSFPLQTPGCILAGQGKLEETIEVGAFLTEVASGYMKGDNLTIKARVFLRYQEGASGVNISSNAITVHVFVPEG